MTTTTSQADRPSWRSRIVTAGIVLLVVVVGGLIASATVPRWWAHRIGDQVNESLTGGILIGLFYGFVFTVLPLAVLALALRWRRTWRAVGIATVTALILAGPNLMTLGIAVGRGNAAHAGQRTLDVQAPGFRGGSLVGVLAALAFAAFVTHLLMSRRRARAGERRARSELAAERTPAHEKPGGE